jgi:hypothetical protein
MHVFSFLDLHFLDDDLLPSGPLLIISYFSTNLEGTAGVWKRSERLVPGTTEATRRAGGQLWVGDPSPAARAAHGCRRQQGPWLQLSIDGVHPFLLLLLLLPIQRLLHLVRLYQLLLLLVVQVRLVLLPLILLDPDFLLLQPLVLQPVLSQLNNKVNNYFSSRITSFRNQIRLIFSRP